MSWQRKAAALSDEMASDTRTRPDVRGVLKSVGFGDRPIWVDGLFLLLIVGVVALMLASVFGDTRHPATLHLLDGSSVQCADTTSHSRVLACETYWGEDRTYPLSSIAFVEWTDD